MKSLSFLVLALSLFLLVGCDAGDEEPIPGTEGHWSPVSCDKDLDAACKTEWNFSFKRSGFPANVSVFINDVKLIDECSPNGRWITSTEADKVKFRLDNYSSIKKTQKINMRVMNLGEPCGTLNKEFIYHDKQEFRVSDDELDDFVIIEA